MSDKLKVAGRMNMTQNVTEQCPVGVNHDVEWPTYRHVSSKVIDTDGNDCYEGDCVVLLPHFLIEEVWAALNEICGNVDADGSGFTKEHFALLDAANANLDAYKHGEYEDHTYDVVELAMK